MLFDNSTATPALFGYCLHGISIPCFTFNLLVSLNLKCVSFWQPTSLVKKKKMKHHIILSVNPLLCFSKRLGLRKKHKHTTIIISKNTHIIFQYHPISNQQSAFILGILTS